MSGAETTTNPIEVTEADREAAADYIRRTYPFEQAAKRFAKAIQKGHSDSIVIVQAFARHRVAALTDMQRWNPTLQGDGPPKDYAEGCIVMWHDPIDGEIEITNGVAWGNSWAFTSNGPNIIGYEPAPAVELVRPDQAEASEPLQSAVRLHAPVDRGPAADEKGEAGDRMTRAQMKMLWQAYGGKQHGPHIEQYYIEEGAWYRFAEAFESRVLEQVTALQSEVAALREGLSEARANFHGMRLGNRCDLTGAVERIDVVLARGGD